MNALTNYRFNAKPAWPISLVLSLLTLCAGLFLAADPAAAHVRWFTDPNDPSLASFPIYGLTDTPVLAWLLIGISLITIAVVLDGRLPVLPIVNTKIRHDAMELMRILTGISLLLTAYGGELIAPHLTAYGAFGTTLVFLQAFIGLLLISNHFLHYAAVLLVALWLGTMAQFGFIKAFEYVNFVGIAAFIFCNHAPSEELRTRLKPYSVDVLRIFTGVALLTLGVTEKLSGAMLGQRFLESYQWNFMPWLGFDWFTDQLFVLSAGSVEAVIGIIMILGVVTRLNTLVIASFMFVSNVVFLLTNDNESALMELVGHMPTIATCIIFLLLGYGQRIKLRNPTLPAQHDTNSGNPSAV